MRAGCVKPGHQDCVHVEALFLQVFKRHIDVAFMGMVVVDLARLGLWFGLTDLKGLFHPKSHPITIFIPCNQMITT